MVVMYFINPETVACDDPRPYFVYGSNPDLVNLPPKHRQKPAPDYKIPVVGNS